MNKNNSENEISSNLINVCTSQYLSTIGNATLDNENVDYKPLYYFLFNGISDILILNEKRIDRTCDIAYSETVEALKKLQCQAEELFLNQMD